MKITRADVAREAGVSVTTVSYVLNGRRAFSEATVKKVHDTVKKLNYHPDMVARSMVFNETKQLAIIVNDITNPLYGEVVLGFETAALQHGYFVNICTGLKNIDEYISNFIARRVDGVYITAVPTKFDKACLDRMHQVGIPVVSSGDIDSESAEISQIEPDFTPGIFEAVNLFKKSGHRKIAMLSAFANNFESDNRLGLFLGCMKTLLPDDEPVLLEGEYPYKSDTDVGRTLARKLVQHHRDVTAVLCTNDLMALGAIGEFGRLGLNVPHDISVIGIDDTSLCELWNPPLTSIGYDKNDFGRRAFEILYNSIVKNVNEKITCDTYLHIRESVGKV